MEPKNILRKQIRERVKNLSAAAKAECSDVVIRKIERDEAFRSAQVVLSFWSLPSEVDTHPFNDKWKDEKTILLPVVVGDVLELRPYRGEGAMQKGAFGILEPVGEPFTELDRIDVAIVPGVVFCKDGRRMGRGGGYYDRLLCHLRGLKIGVCFPCQVVDDLPTEAWDVPVDKVLF